MKRLISLFIPVLLTGCMSISEVIQVPAEQQTKAQQFELPVVAGPAESVVYVVNKKPKEPFRWDQGLIFTSQLEIGGYKPLVTIPGEYAVMTLKPGTYEVGASRICSKTAKSAASTPEPGTVMKVYETGWETYRAVYGRNMTMKDREFEFQPGKTYVFSMLTNCAMVIQAGGVIFYPRIQLTDEVGGKYLVMTNSPAASR